MNEEMTNLFSNDAYAKKLNIKLVEWDEGYAKTEITITEEMLNFHKAAHGGLVFSLADYAFAIASNSHGQVAVGISTNMSYVEAAELGERLTCTATEVNNNGRLAIYNMEVKGDNGNLKATMEGMVYRKRETFAKTAVKVKE